MACFRRADCIAWTAWLALASGCGRLGLEVLDLGPDDTQSKITPGAGECAEDAEAGACDDDWDRDGISNEVDNCPELENPDQADADADGLGDGCDEDDDSVPDLTDECPLDASRSLAGACCGVPAPPGLLAHYRFDETSGDLAADDLSGATHGALTNFAEQTWTTGQLGGALGFDGVDDYVRVATAYPEVRSLSFWVKPESLHTTLDQTDWLSPSTHGPSSQWSNPDRAYTNDGRTASSGISLATKHQHWGGFGVVLPPGVIVRGIAFSVRSSTFNLLSNFSASLSWDGGNGHTSSKAEFALLGLGADVQSVGGESDTWGRAWTADELSDANFRVRASFWGLIGSMAIDHVQVKVYHSAYEQGRSLFSLNDTTRVSFGAGPEFALVGWEGTSVYVNGVLGATLRDDWNHVVITGPQAVGGDALHIGHVPSDRLSPSFHGWLDDVRVFDEALGEEHVRTLLDKPECRD